MSASARSIEVKVGLLILTALVLLAAFILVMGGINFQPTFDVAVAFDNPGGLQSGAPVKIAGVKVGKVVQIDFVGDQPPDPRVPAGLVRARVAVERRYQKAIHDNATFYITTQGVLGEQFLAIDPGSSDRPLLEPGAVVRGLDPPRLDRLLAESYDLLHTMVAAMREHRPQIRDAFEGLSKTLKGTGVFMERNQDRLDRVAENIEKITEEGLETVKDARQKYVHNPVIDGILADVAQLAHASARDVPGLLGQGKEALGHASKLVGAFATDEEIARVRGLIADAAAATNNVKLATADARAIAAHIRRGKGSVGALVMDEQLFDDLQELARDLKHNPWKFFWKE
jgi:phospholipid/cholesterol/gamma-HCH transport system substrate-binding protein